ncbi:MAG: DUF4258 domain-containing protein [SAR324 cluster bacterium]|nr:DUF4258 domain-containing protein [SAR324 cluster bacterium]
MEHLEIVRERLSEGKFDFSHHAFKRSVERNISLAEIREAGKLIEVIEDYPDDKYSPSCLLLGLTVNGRPLHIQVSLGNLEIIRIITLYEPDENEWIDYKERRR